MLAQIGKFVGKLAVTVATAVVVKKLADRIDEMTTPAKMVYEPPKPVGKPMKVVRGKVYLPESDFQVS